MLCRFVFSLFVIIWCVSCSGPSGEKSSGNGTEVHLMINAEILTMDGERSVADAMAFRDGRIIAIGTEVDVRAAVGEYPIIHDLGGRAIVPGFFESHDHLFMSSTTSIMTDVSPFTTPTLAEALEKIESTQVDDEGWIIAFGADQELYEEGGGPTRDLLDELFPDTPVLVFHLSGHGGFANSEALRLAGVDESTPDPTGGFYDKNDAGELTGYLAGQPALFSVKSYPVATVETAFVAGDLRASRGITTASELGIMNKHVLAGIVEATSVEGFPVRLVGGYFLTAPDFDEIVPRLKSFENDLLSIPFIKTWTDGSLQGGTAHLQHGYHDPDMGAGGAQGTQAFFNEQVLKMCKLGYWPAIHANGDGAVEVALNAIEFARDTLGDEAFEGIRPQIIHAQYTELEQLERMAELKVYPTFFTTHVYYWGDMHFEKSLGPERAQRLSAMGDAFRLGLTPSMHNDPPVSPVNPMLNMWIAVNRKSVSGRVLGTEQAITVEQALEAYTINAAFQFGMEEDAGSLEIGKYADFVVLNKNPLKVHTDAIRDIEVLTTVLGGRLTFADYPE